MKYILVHYWTGWCPQLKQSISTSEIILGEVGCPSQSRVPPSRGYPDLFRQNEKTQICAWGVNNVRAKRQPVICILAFRGNKQGCRYIWFHQTFQDCPFKCCFFLLPYKQSRRATRSFMHHFVQYIKRLVKSVWIFNDLTSVATWNNGHITFIKILWSIYNAQVGSDRC